MQHNTQAPWAELVPGARSPLTADELLVLADDRWRYELVEGKLIRMAPTGGGHGRTSIKLSVALETFVERGNLGVVVGAETGFIISGAGEPDTVLAPDIAFVRAERVPGSDTPEWDAYWRLAPDLVVEIVSPSQYRPEMAEKARLWLHAGVRLLWVIWPRSKEVDVWRPVDLDTPTATLGAADRLDGLDVLPGFTCPVAQLFN